MAQARRGLPDVYVTSLTALAAGEAFCHYAPWYRARFWIQSVDPDFDKAGWIADHARMLSIRREELRAEHFDVFIEHQNTFTLTGIGAKVSGKPDIVAVRNLAGMERDAVVSDVKTGQRRNEHLAQVLTYMAVLPKVRKDLAGYTLRGELVYKEARVDIAPEEVTPEFKQALWAHLREIGNTIPPAKTPSAQECGNCPLTHDDCPEKASALRAFGSSTDF